MKMNLIKTVLLSKIFHLVVLAILAATSLAEVIREASEMNGFHLSNLGAHHGLFLYALATLIKESWEMLETNEERHSEHD
jgi:SAM-dependent MidA family methyltransferase